MLSYSIIGMGAIGGYYGGRLAKAGREVHFLAHSDYQYVLQNGLRVESCDGDFCLPHINAYATQKDMPKTDVIIVGLKSVKNHDVLPELLRPIVHQNSIVILIQNGIGLEDDLQKEFPGLQIVAGLAFICSAKVGPGHVSHQCYGSINLGNYSCQQEKFEVLLQDMTDAGIQAAEVPYLEQYRQAAEEPSHTPADIRPDDGGDWRRQCPGCKHPDI